MNTYYIYETNIHKNIELPTNKTQKIKENSSNVINIQMNTGYTLGRIDPNHISNTPPNHFMENLRKRIDIYYTPNTINT